MPLFAANWTLLPFVFSSLQTLFAKQGGGHPQSVPVQWRRTTSLAPNHYTSRRIVTAASQPDGCARRMHITLTILGTILTLAALQDLFHTLFHPAARGAISDWIAHGIWRAFKAVLPKRLTFAGPVAFAATVFYWAASVVIGFALIYEPRLPGDFVFAAGLNPEKYASMQGAIDVSLCALTTASTGVNAKLLWLQFLVGCEALFGFVLLSASVSWILSIYPVLEHRRSLAHQANLLHYAEASGIRRLDQVPDSDLEEILLGLASQMTTHRNELTHFPIVYYFHEDESETALAGILSYLADIAEQSVHRGGGVPIAAAALGGAINDFLKVIASMFLHRKFRDPREILRAYAEDHMQQVVRSPRVRAEAA